MDLILNLCLIWSFLLLMKDSKASWLSGWSSSAVGNRCKFVFCLFSLSFFYHLLRKSIRLITLLGVTAVKLCLRLFQMTFTKKHFVLKDLKRGILALAGFSTKASSILSYNCMPKTNWNYCLLLKHYSNNAWLKQYPHPPHKHTWL